jgi:hypothetical protein
MTWQLKIRFEELEDLDDVEEVKKKIEQGLYRGYLNNGTYFDLEKDY